MGESIQTHLVSHEQPTTKIVFQQLRGYKMKTPCSQKRDGSNHDNNTNNHSMNDELRAALPFQGHKQ
jgi:hypothetical protein